MLGADQDIHRHFNSQNFTQVPYCLYSIPNSELLQQLSKEVKPIANGNQNDLRIY